MTAARELKVFLCGEGKNELGSRAGEATDEKEAPGVLEALLRGVQSDGWIIGGARLWKSYRKYQVHGIPTRGDAATVRKIALDASEHGCDIAAFLRDEDGDPNRRAQVEKGIAEALGDGDPDIAIAGSVVVPAIEGWILAHKSVRKTEAMSRRRAAEKLAKLLAPAPVNTAAMVCIVENADPASLPDDARSLLEWRASAEKAFQRAARTA